MRNVENLIYEMLTENTGSHMCDSGGAYGRHWEKNQKKTLQEFRNEKEQTIIKEGDYYERCVSVFHYLSELELDDICKHFNFKNTNPKDWDADFEGYGVSKGAWEWLTDNCVVEEQQSFNTYNGESDLSQVLQGTWLTINDEQYILIQIHNGCDVRGGYTDAKLFKTQDEWMIHPYLQEFMYQEEIEEELEYGLELEIEK